MENILEEFKKYYFEIKESNKYEKTKNEFYIALQDFQENYSLEKLNALSVNDYVLGTDNKDSLCYKIEFGKYRWAGPGIGGSTAYKYGIYFSKDKNEYRSAEHGYEPNPDEQFNKIKADLIRVIESVKNANSVDDIFDDYSSLKNMPMFINKLTYLYLPHKLLPFAGKTHIKSIATLFGIDYNDELSSLKINYLINQFIRNIDGLQNEDSCLLGNIVWDFYMMKNPKEEKTEKNRIWMYAPGENASEWENCYNNGIMVLGWSELGDLRQYSSKAEIKEILATDRGGSNMNNALANWEFLNKMQIGDIVYAKKGTSTLIGKGIVESEYLFDESREYYKSYRKVKWLNRDEKEVEKNNKLAIKTLTDITKYTEYVKYLESLYIDNKQIVSENINEYDKYDFLEEVLISEDKYDTIVNTLLRKKNIILQGAPGVGKTFCAKKIMYSIMNEKADSRIRVVQFHQSYSYEDFVQGYRPNEDGKFELKNGVFYDLVMEAIEECKIAKANNVEPKKYAIIIDEINRGNLSKVFGELMMLIESDKRNEKWSINLTYSDDEFYIPENLYIIGTMNTADRSLAMIDYALRRRFAFIELEPAFESEKLRKYLVEKEKIDTEVVNRIIENFKSLNYYIKETLGKDFMIGHSYFINQQLDSEDYENIYNDIIEYEIKPLLEEYYFDDKNKVIECLSRINKV